MAIQLKADVRNVAGKGAARAVRNNKKIPAVIYGEKKDPVSIELDGHSWVQLIKKPGLRTKLFEIDTGKGTESAVLVDIQYHPVSDAPIHVDFKRVDVKKPMSITIPVELINTDISRGIKSGGTLNFAIRKVDIVATIENVPEKIIIDMADVGVGDVIHGSKLVLPAGVELGLHMEDLAFAMVAGKGGAQEEAAPTTEEPAKK